MNATPAERKPKPWDKAGSETFHRQADGWYICQSFTEHEYLVKPTSCGCIGFGMKTECRHITNLAMLLTVAPPMPGGYLVYGCVSWCAHCSHWKYNATWHFEGKGDLRMAKCGCHGGGDVIQ